VCSDVAHIGHHRLELLGHLHRMVEDRLELERFRLQVARQRDVVQRQQVAQLGGKALGVLQVLHAQRAAGHLVFVGRADALAGGADLAGAAGLAQRFASAVDLDVERQDQRAGFADEQPRAHLEPMPSSRSISSADASGRPPRRCRCSRPRRRA
jgi:hypothetical protein